jgi:hypothetical protein
MKSLALLLVRPVRHLYALLWRAGLIEIEDTDGDRPT